LRCFSTPSASRLSDRGNSVLRSSVVPFSPSPLLPFSPSPLLPFSPSLFSCVLFFSCCLWLVGWCFSTCLPLRLASLGSLPTVTAKVVTWWLAAQPLPSSLSLSLSASHADTQVRCHTAKLFIGRLAVPFFCHDAQKFIRCLYNPHRNTPIGTLNHGL